MVFSINKLGSLIGGGRGAKKAGYPKTLQASNFGAVAKTVITTDYTKIGEYSIPAQQKVNVGYGSPAQPDNQGYIYFNSDSEDSVTKVSEHGMFRITVANANETVVVKVFEERTNVLEGSATDRAQKVPLPEKDVSGEFGRIPSEDDKIQIWLKADTAGTAGTSGWSPTISILYLPVTNYQL